MRAFSTIPIKECGEPLVPVPRKGFAFFNSHPYMAAGAPYGSASPWALRKGVLEALERVQKKLEVARPGWKIMLYDAYRPNAVQAYMVEMEMTLLAQAAGLNPLGLTQAQRKEVENKVFRVWAVPSGDPATPPPHSTGAAVDCTLADEMGREADMGSPIDENSDRSNPDYFAQAIDAAGRAAHANRIFLYELMRAEGFHRMTDEWWHFSLGDQYWAWAKRENGGDPATVAKYGRADLL